ncbi:MAG: hypothetical protein M1826_000240 [Phylliscum demangeonii]|nr:MAG: hypothetical protein M1826_000240 [Phylliscum demangeonii]
MSLFPANDFGALFRLLDDYDVHRDGRGGGGGSSHRAVRSFQPKFDVQETKDGYELHGELPGIDQNNITIEFSDPHTLVVKGRIEREYHSGTPQGRITGDVTVHEHGQQQQHGSHHATVEDEPEDGKAAGKADGKADGKKAAEQQQVSKKEKDGQQVQPHHGKLWVSERSIGEFYRSFSFPTRVDQDAVKAKLNNGILTIAVPKAAPPQARRINIE